MLYSVLGATVKTAVNFVRFSFRSQKAQGKCYCVSRMTWTQVYDPFGHWWLSTFVAALPIIVLLTLLAGLRVKPHWSALAGAGTALFIAILAFRMPVSLATASFAYGVAFGLLKIAWIVVAA